MGDKVSLKFSSEIGVIYAIVGRKRQIQWDDGELGWLGWESQDLIRVQDFCQALTEITKEQNDTN